nr:hypothetical protein [Embleya scabrispora]
MREAVRGALQDGPGRFTRSAARGRSEHLAAQLAVPARRALALEVGQDQHAPRARRYLGGHRSSAGTAVTETRRNAGAYLAALPVTVADA